MYLPSSSSSDEDGNASQNDIYDHALLQYLSGGTFCFSNQCLTGEFKIIHAIRMLRQVESHYRLCHV